MAPVDQEILPEQNNINTNLRGSMGHHGISGWFSDSFAQSFDHNQGCSQWPVAGQSQKRHSQKVESIADDSQEPVIFSLSAIMPVRKPESIANEFTQPGNQTNDKG